MMWLRKKLDQIKPLFEKDGKFASLHPVFDAFETFLFVPNHTTGPRQEVHVRDAMDLKRMMVTVIIALVPCLLFGMWNVGHQKALATGIAMTGWEKFLFGLEKTLPIIIVSYVVGLGIEFTFASIRKHSVNEGFLVTGMLIPLVVPPTIPLWQVAVATAFAVVLGKEVFGGTGMNVLNVALTARAYLYFAHPSDIAGSGIWVATEKQATVDGYTGETALSVAATTASKLKEAGQAFSAESVVQALNDYMGGMFTFKNMFLGTIPGSIGETSTLMCLIGALILIATGVGSWKIMVSAFGGAYLTALFFNAIASDAYMAMPAHYHLVMGGLAFGIVFMATDPVSAAHTETGKWIYGFLIGVITILIRVLNPAYPEGIMLAILFMNVMAPLIDFYVVEANKKRRLSRATV
ncbi:Na+-transporting NADH:ubiquinone oxidoreductase subunit B [Thermonema lapsum]|uniref:Na(+)-translocating NADH-quinone reductase subunit B n=1 Tax=Thermonema lapsum TaxID=28195 RepID=A0A846MNL6_9BACT|nr:NADH:ubiquinone reductase (Na(+)-transporting) subunit B [Thermonema lapsum]NIK73094.1 Na+-transporting NADH:ubiquinone oxidoreductase subunit B [Thermonema lapsum]